MNALDPKLYTIVLIAPLEIEAKAAFYMLDNRHSGRFRTSRGDNYIYRAGDINGHNIVIATLPPTQTYGTGSAAALASQTKKFFPNLWFGLLVGVAAGLPNPSKTSSRDIRLGDILVALPEGQNAGLIAYDLRKETADGPELLRCGHALAVTESVVGSAIASLKFEDNPTDAFLHLYEKIKNEKHDEGDFTDPGQEYDVLYETNDDGLEQIVPRERRAPDERTRVWYGPIGSGDKLVKNRQKRNDLRDTYNIIGLEMEAAGTMNCIPVGVIRGVCDYGDEHKNKRWQPYAAAMAAAYAKALLHEIGPGDAAPIAGDPLLNGEVLVDLPIKTDRFFGRQIELSKMHTCLCNSSAESRRLVLCGISGSGKTQLVLEFVAQLSDKFSAILWIDACSKTSFAHSIRNCVARIHRVVPEFQSRQGNPSESDLLLDWLKTPRNKNWLLVIDRADDVPSYKNSLDRFLALDHGAICVTTTNRVLATTRQIEHIAVEGLDVEASQSFVLWLVFGDVKSHSYETRHAASLAAKVVHRFPLGLELAGILIREGITPLKDFPQTFTHDYKKLAPFKLEWFGDGSSSLYSIFNALYDSIMSKNAGAGLLITLCAIYGPWSIPISLLQGLRMSEGSSDWAQLQALIDDTISLKLAIHELHRVSMIKKMQDSDGTILSISLHAAICQWRFATIGEQKADWIMQASYGLARFLELERSRQGKAIAGHHLTDVFYRLSNLFDRCLDAIWKHVNERDLEPPDGRFSSLYFTICSNIAESYLLLGRFTIAKGLFSAAIGYIRATNAEKSSSRKLLQFLSGFAKACGKTGELNDAEEALQDALVIAEQVYGHTSGHSLSIASQLKTVKDSIHRELCHRVRALLASTETQSKNMEYQPSAIQEQFNSMAPMLHFLGNTTITLSLSTKPIIVVRDLDDDSGRGTVLQKATLQLRVNEPARVRALCVSFRNVDLYLFRADCDDFNTPYGNCCRYSIDKDDGSLPQPTVYQSAENVYDSQVPAAEVKCDALDQQATSESEATNPKSPDQAESISLKSHSTESTSREKKGLAFDQIDPCTPLFPAGLFEYRFEIGFEFGPGVPDLEMTSSKLRSMDTREWNITVRLLRGISEFPMIWSKGFSGWMP